MMPDRDLATHVRRAGRLAAGAALALTGLALGPVAPEAAAQESGHAGHGAGHREGGQEATPLTEPGNAAFAAVREVVQELERRGDTDWSRVDLEALRRHLRDMRSFTLEAEVAQREPVEGGLRVVVTGPDSAATAAIRRALHAHSSMLERETGWSAGVENRGGRTVLTVVGSSAADAEKIRGLGYIGLMATGAHHQRHHWMIATGQSPHGG